MNSSDTPAGNTVTPPVAEKGQGDGLAVSVIICAYTQRRWAQIKTAVESVFSQGSVPAQVLLVIDHNPDLAVRARAEFPMVTILENDDAAGLSGARNTGLRAASQPIVAFLDDDATARRGWLASLVAPYCNSDVMATGGSVHPRWPAVRPRWLPPEFDWVIGCSYLGLPTSMGPIRNPIGANMSMRTRAALEVGGFDACVGRTGSKPRGCEETELAIRLTASRPGSEVLYVPAAAVNHYVGQERLTFSYFLRRCWHEGVSKAAVVRLAGYSAGLGQERHHATVVIPAALARSVRSLAAGDPSAILRIGAAITGLTAAALGYSAGHVSRLKAVGVRPPGTQTLKGPGNEDRPSLAPIPAGSRRGGETCLPPIRGASGPRP